MSGCRARVQFCWLCSLSLPGKGGEGGHQSMRTYQVCNIRCDGVSSVCLHGYCSVACGCFGSRDGACASGRSVRVSRASRKAGHLSCVFIQRANVFFVKFVYNKTFSL